MNSQGSSRGRQGSRIRVCLIVGNADTGGVETFVRHVVRTIDREQFRISVYVLGHAGALAKELESLEVRTRHLSSQKSNPVARSCALLRSLYQDRVEIVHANVGGRVVRWAARMAGARAVISHVHGPPDSQVGSFRAATPDVARYMNSHFYSGADLVLACSEWVHHRMTEASPAVRHKARVLRCGVDGPSRFDSAVLRRDLGLEPHGMTVGFVGRLVPQKGIPYVVEVAERLLGASQRLQVAIIGDGPCIARLQPAAEKFGGRLRLLGARADAARIMQAFDVLIVPSEWEAFGIVSIEAQAAGVPVVAFDVDGLRESLSDGVTGVLVPHRDTLAMAEAVAELLADPARRRAMGAAGVQLVAERFSAEGMVSQLAQIYGRLAGGK